MPLPGIVDATALDPEQGSIVPSEMVPDECSHFWVNAEYLLWWFKDSPLPVPLLTTTSNPNSMPIAGLNDPYTRVVLGDHNLDTGVHQGTRLTTGLWIDSGHQFALEGGYFVMANQNTVRTAVSGGQPGAPILAVPFFDFDTATENTFLVASPGLFAGSAVLSLTTRLQGAEIQGAFQAIAGKNLHVEILAGFRFLDLTENLSYATASTGLSGTNTGLVLNTADTFGMQNLFYGWQVGARADYRLGNFEISASAKLALGDMLQTATLNGLTLTNFFNAPPGGPFTSVPPQSFPGAGVFVQPSNVGRISRDRIAIVPEVNVTLSYQITKNLWAFAGYDFLYINKVLRPGNQIDRGINASETLQNAVAGNAIVPGSQPALTLQNSDFWAQGAHLGLEFCY